MSFRFAHNKIDTRTGIPTLAEWYKQDQTKKALASGKGTVKTASAVAETKVASPVKKEAKIPDFIQEKIDAKKNKGKEDGEEKDEKDEKKEATKKGVTKVAEDKEEGESSGQPEHEGKVTNDPNKDDKKETKKSGGGKKDSDEGESSGQLDVEPLHQKGESTGEKPGSLDTQKGKEAKTTAKFVRFAELTDKQKKFLRATWSLYWPKTFIDALLG